LPSLRGMAKAKTAQIGVWTAADIEASRESIGRAGSATVVVKTFVPERVRTGQVLKGTVEEQVQNLIINLKQARVV
jgi:electron transfer flavoprotein alpha/beta subunit